jgi:hypothetical protein
MPWYHMGTGMIDALRAGAEFPPVVVLATQSGWTLLDGVNRTYANWGAQMPDDPRIRALDLTPDGQSQFPDSHRAKQGLRSESREPSPDAIAGVLELNAPIAAGPRHPSTSGARCRNPTVPLPRTENRQRASPRRHGQSQRPIRFRS